MLRLITLCLLLEVFLLSSHNAYCNSSDEVPITLNVANRQWDLPESTLVGTVIASLTTSKSSPESEFGIEGVNGTEKFFTVDRKTGMVTLKSSLNYATHPTLSLYVILRNGINNPPHKVEIFVRVLPTFSSTTTPSTSSYQIVSNNTVIITDQFIATSDSYSGIFSSVEGSQPFPSESIITPDSDYSDPDIPYVNTVPNEHLYNANLSTSTSYLTSSHAVPTNNKNDNSVHISNTTLIAISVPTLLVIILFPSITAAICWKVRRKQRRGHHFHRPTQLNPLYYRAPANGYIYSTPEASPSMIDAGPQEVTTKNDVLVFAENKWNELVEPLNYNPSSYLIPDDKWECPHESVNFIGVLGEGCFGKVWQAEFRSESELLEVSIVAVKTLKDNASDKDKKDLLCELNVMKMLDPHPNVVKLLGCCTARDPIYVVMEFVARGKLQTYLRDRRCNKYSYTVLNSDNTLMTSRDLTCFSYQVAKGMQYLASKGILHRDLAARNILIGENKVCKISDFGLARDVIENHVYQRKSEGRLPIRWMAPESLYDNIFTTKTDVWSFGILMWEIITLGSTPYAGVTAADLMKRVKDGYRLEKPNHCKRELYNVMYYCWDADPEQRPTFDELCDLLEKLLLSEAEYIDLNIFPDHCYYNMSNLPGEKL